MFPNIKAAQYCSTPLRQNSDAPPVRFDGPLPISSPYKRCQYSPRCLRRRRRSVSRICKFILRVCPSGEDHSDQGQRGKSDAHLFGSSQATDHAGLVVVDMPFLECIQKRVYRDSLDHGVIPGQSWYRSIRAAPVADRAVDLRVPKS